jgi:hypothetical protein
MFGSTAKAMMMVKTILCFISSNVAENSLSFFDEMIFNTQVNVNFTLLFGDLLEH